MTLIALYDIESNGLLRPSKGKTLGTKTHCIGAKIGHVWYVGMDDYEAEGVPSWCSNGVTHSVSLPPQADGKVITLPDVQFLTIVRLLEELEKADIRVGHNSQDFDERFLRKCYPWWSPKKVVRDGVNVSVLDSLLLWRLLYPSIYRDAPNTHKVPGQLKMRYSLEALGYRLGEKKDKGFDPGDWQTFSWDMVTYMLQDVAVLEKAFNWAMRQKPPTAAVEIEHGFADIIRRQECWGFTFDYEAALRLQAKVNKVITELELELVATYGEWWVAGKVTYPKADREVKLSGFEDVTVPRYGTKGNPLRPYVGPPKCGFSVGAPYTPITRTEFNPGSRDHVRLMLERRHGWVPKQFTDKGTPEVNDEVLRALDYEEAPKLADYYAAKKVSGYVGEGKKAWLLVAHEEPDAWRMHGSVNTMGTYTFRCSHMDPNCGQIPTRDPTYGHLCRELFVARHGFVLVGFDGSGVQLRGLAHYLARGGRWGSGARWGDDGAYVKVFQDGIDPHGFMRDTIGTDLMGQDDEGRRNGKTMNYALCFGGGDERLGSICRPHGSQQMKRDIGKEVKKRMLPVFGTAFDDLKAFLKEYVEGHRSVIGLDGTVARVTKPHAALATLLQLFEAKVMKKTLILHNGRLLELGFVPGVDAAGQVDALRADWEYCANVHDEVQADVRPHRVALYTEVSEWAVPEAGRQLRVLCPLKADVKSGTNWSATH